MNNLSLIVDPEKMKLAIAQKKRDAYLKIVNQKPPAKWIKKHPMGGHEYIPIEIIENTLTMLFQEWSVEVKQVQQILNSVAVTVRVHYKDPITGQICFQDGVGAAPAQAEARQSLSIATIKSNAIQIGLPAAKSYAIKDAVEHIGRLFGRDIGRKDSPDFSPRYENKENEEEKRIIDFINSAKTKDQLESIKSQLIDQNCLTVEYEGFINSKLLSL